MQPLDLAVVGVYLIAVVWLGLSFGRTQRTVQDYFLTHQGVPWWAVMASIVATETSTVTLISVPGYAFGGDLTFLQLALGYVIGRIVVSVLFIPAYFTGELLTAYQVLTRRFGPAVGRLAASIFVLTRNLSDGFRLFATGLVVAAILMATPNAVAFARYSAPAIDPSVALLAAGVLAVGMSTLVYTLFGGMTAVIWTDACQFLIYLGGSVAAAVVLLGQIPGGWAEVVEVAGPLGKFRLLDFSWDVTRSYTVWSGLVGGAFLTVATHGTDQLIVQRYLCARSSAQASRALIVSGAVVFAQFAMFLIVGTMLYVYYTGHEPATLASLMRDAQVQTDRVFPAFVVSHLPSGLRGLVVAAMFAAAMSTLSSSLNSSASSVMADFYMPLTGGTRAPHHYLAIARTATVVCGIVQIGVALVAIDVSSRVVDEVLGIASFTNGLVLGVFVLGRFTHVRSGAALFGLGAGATGMLLLRLLTQVSWQWYVLVGALLTVGTASLVSSLAPPGGGRPPLLRRVGEAPGRR